MQQTIANIRSSLISIFIMDCALLLKIALLLLSRRTLLSRVEASDITGLTANDAGHFTPDISCKY